MAKINGRTIIITGASSGIGAATAVALAAKRTNLILAARRVEKLEEVADRCRAAGAAAVVILHCDVSKRADVDCLVSVAAESFGRLDVMIANAGYGFLAKIQDTTDEQFDEIVTANVKGTWYAMQAAAKVMLKQAPLPGHKRDARGHIIAVSSGAGKRGLPLYGVYSMTKAAQLSLAQAMRVELQPEGVYVSTVHPLTTATEFFDVASSKSRVRSSGVGRVQSAEVVANKIVGLIRRPRPELWPAFMSRWALTFAGIFPSCTDKAMARMIRQRVG